MKLNINSDVFGTPVVVVSLGLHNINIAHLIKIFSYL